MKKLKYPISCVTLMLLFLNSSLLGQIEYNEIDWGLHPMKYSTVGTVGWQFLKLPTNARNAALGGINSSINSGNANSALTNPASTADVENVDFAFNYMNWVADIGFNTLAVVKNFNNWGVLGINLIYVDYGQEIRTEYQEEILVSDIVHTPITDGLGTFGANDLAIGISYARQITDRLQIGSNFKYLEERIDDAKTSTWSLDIGTMFYTGFKTLRIAMLGRNFGPDAEYREYANRIEKVPFRVKMPMLLSFGAAIDIIEEKANPHRLTFAFEYLSPNDGQKKINIGSEYALMKMLFLRVGYRFNYDEEGLTFGGGVNYKIQGVSANFDYAYLDVGLFKQVHMFSIGIHL